nr:MraY family glycosyltransferase [Verrucomicrobium spinosum]
MMWLLFTGAILVSALGTWLIIRQNSGLGMDHPDQHRKLHTTPVPRLGGLPVFVALCLGFAFATWWLPDFFAQWWPIILTNLLIFSVGFADDLRPLGARVKLVGQIGAACILYALGISIDSLSNPFGEGQIVLGWWGLPITLLWLISIPNIINLIDGMDGLATGFGLFLSLTLAFVGHFARMPDVVLISVVMSGASLAFSSSTCHRRASSLGMEEPTSLASLSPLSPSFPPTRGRSSPHCWWSSSLWACRFLTPSLPSFAGSCAEYPSSAPMPSISIIA